jgi:glyoxylase-like metal-dependent hydrolase (beta-lactamase superfamily II)
MSIDLRSSESEPSPSGQSSPSSTADQRTPFKTYKKTLNPIRELGNKLKTVPSNGRYYDVAQDILGIKTGLSNVFLVGAPGSSQWVLVDAGMPGSANLIVSTAARRFGANVPPSAIILTHGHFDHVGSIISLCRRWDVPIYAHTLEMPYLTGRSSYPPPDPSVGNGLMSLLSSMYPKKPIDLGHRVRVLPPNGLISQLPGWRWMPTPGHTPGHISLFRNDDRCLIAGDAIVSVRAESLVANLLLTPEMHGPPMYFTPDWHASRESVRAIAALQPEIVATGHGIPLYGEEMQMRLGKLARNFELEAVPDHGRYLRGPAIADESGVIHVPPSQPQPGVSGAMILGGLAMGLALGWMAGPRRHREWRDLL